MWALQAAEKGSASPEGTAENSPGRQSWVSKDRKDPVPSGTAEILCSCVQPSLTGLFALLMFSPGLASWAIFSRPFGTRAGFFRTLLKPRFLLGFYGPTKVVP